MHVTLVLFPQLTPLDAVGPYEALIRMPQSVVELAAMQPGPMTTSRGPLLLNADRSLASIASTDVLLVPGGPGTRALERDEALLAELGTPPPELKERVRRAQKEAARIREEKEEDARRAARREAMGRQLNEEADRRKAAEAAAATRPQSTLPYSYSSARRARLWGRSDANAELVLYAEAWARKIQFNTPVETVREVAKRPHTTPMVTVAIRSDGSVESVTFVVSSGVAEVDEAIRRIVQSHAVYPPFPPALSREYDVVEVRRTWHFDTAIRLY